MQKIEELLESLEHFGETEYSFEIRFCGKEGCGICAGFGRSVRTSCEVNNKIREEVLRFQDLSIPNPVDKYHFFEHMKQDITLKNPRCVLMIKQYSYQHF